MSRDVFIARVGKHNSPRPGSLPESVRRALDPRPNGNGTEPRRLCRTCGRWSHTAAKFATGLRCPVCGSPRSAADA